MEEHVVESNCNIMIFLMFAEYYLMRAGIPGHVACLEFWGNASIL